MKIILASTSPRRKELMSLITKDFVQMSPNVEENEYSYLSAKDKALQLSKDKCHGALKALKDKNSAIISCDTVVDLDGRVLEKPADPKQAYKMLRALSGKTHLVHSAVSVHFKGIMYSFVQSARVEFDTIPLNVIVEYIKTDEPYDKAGGYAIQGFMCRYIKKIDGDYYTVVGLPVQRLYKLLSFIDIV